MRLTSPPRRPLRVVRVIDRLNVGGPAIHAVLVSAGMTQHRCATLLVHGEIDGSEGDMSYLLAQHAVTTLRLSCLSRAPRPLQDLRALWALYRLMRRHRPDVVHTHKSKAGALGRVAALLAGVPVRVHTYHGHVLSGYFHPLVARGIVLCERALALGTTRLLTVSERLRDELSQERGVAPQSRFRVVPLGLDLAPFRQAEQHRGGLRRELGLPTDTALIGVVGRMVPIKDHATFLAGFAALRAQPGAPPVHAVLVGAGERLAELQALASHLGIRDAVSFLGWRRDLPQIYADLDALALTSRNEGTPVAVIEALAAGVPVVATHVGGVADVLQGGARGLLIPPADPEALARGLRRLLCEESLRARARAPAQRDAVCIEYGIERLCRDLSHLYREELAAAEGPPERVAAPPAAWTLQKGVAATGKGQY